MLFLFDEELTWSACLCFATDGSLFLGFWFLLHISADTPFPPELVCVKFCEIRVAGAVVVGIAGGFTTVVKKNIRNECCLCHGSAL